MKAFSTWCHEETGMYNEWQDERAGGRRVGHLINKEPGPFPCREALLPVHVATPGILIQVYEIPEPEAHTSCQRNLLTGLCSQSLCMTLKDALRRYKPQMIAGSDLLLHTKLSPFWILLHGQRGWQWGAVGGGWPKIHTKNLQWLLSSGLFLTFKIVGGQLKSFHGGIEVRRFCNKTEEILLKYHNNIDSRKTSTVANVTLRLRRVHLSDIFRILFLVLSCWLFL